MNDLNINALRHWVTESTRKSSLNKNSKTIEARIQGILDNTTPLIQEMVVYRGQQEESRRIIPYSWFSTSSDIEKVLRQHISNKADCCLFKIHLLAGVRCFQVDKTLEQYGRKPTGYNESEIIVNGGGVFYANKDLSVLGFSAPTRFKGVEMFETWYAPIPPPQPSIKELSADDFFSRILEDEYNLIETQNNLKDWPGLLDPDERVSNTAYAEVWNRISKKKAAQAGGRRMTRKQRGGLAVFYNSVKVNGQQLSAEKTAKRPTVKIPTGYFLVMYDPNAVNPDWIHWIATAEKDILEYQGPTPPPGTGIHTYKFVLNSGIPPQAPRERGGQQITEFLKNPVAVAEFTVAAK